MIYGQSDLFRMSCEAPTQEAAKRHHSSLRSAITFGCEAPTQEAAKRQHRRLRSANTGGCEAPPQETAKRQHRRLRSANTGGCGPLVIKKGLWIGITSKAQRSYDLTKRGNCDIMHPATEIYIL